MDNLDSILKVNPEESRVYRGTGLIWKKRLLAAFLFSFPFEVEAIDAALNVDGTV